MNDARLSSFIFKYAILEPMEFLGDIFSTLLSSLEHLGVWAYLVIFLIALTDSLVVLGTFTPGAAFLFFAGVLVARGLYGLPEMIIFAVVGAILGGVISYHLGKLEANYARRKHWFPKERHLERGARMLAKRGGWGIFFARFLGPLSSIMTFVAGTARMPLRRFLFWNTLAGLAWGSSYILAGYLVTSSLSQFKIF
jgi:membrane protein DedA with SNARE-associated domain